MLRSHRSSSGRSRERKLLGGGGLAYQNRRNERRSHHQSPANVQAHGAAHRIIHLVPPAGTATDPYELRSSMTPESSDSTASQSNQRQSDHPLGGALSNLRVLDMSRVLAGPWCGQLLADLG